MAHTTAELKELIEAWVAMYIKQDVNFKAGAVLTTERLNELYNLLIDQADNANTVLEYVRDYLPRYTTDTDVLVASWVAQMQQAIVNTDASIASANNALSNIASTSETILLAVSSANAARDAANTAANNAQASAQNLEQNYAPRLETIENNLSIMPIDGGTFFEGAPGGQYDGGTF